jgi:hypothetical protein
MEEISLLGEVPIAGLGSDGIVVTVEVLLCFVLIEDYTIVGTVKDLKQLFVLVRVLPSFVGGTVIVLAVQLFEMNMLLSMWLDELDIFQL